jgi:hypothetical protein
MESLDVEDQRPKKPYKLSISFNIEDDISELKDLEDEADKVVSKYARHN